MLSETPCQKSPFPITAKKPLLKLSEKAFSDQIFLDKIMNFRQDALVEKCCLKWFCTPRRRQMPSGSTQETVHAALFSVIYFGMTITRAENVCLSQRPTELIALAENIPDGSIWPLYVGVQSIRSRIETEAELDS